MRITKRPVLNTSRTRIPLVVPMQFSVKNIEQKIFREFKAESIGEGLPVGKSLHLAMKLWLDKNKKRKLLDYKPRSWGKGTEHLSEHMDEVLYS